MRFTNGRFRSLLLCLGLVHGVQAATSIIPGVSNAGSFTTEIRVNNTSSSSANLTFAFLSADGQTTVSPASQALAPGQTLALSDALAGLWNLATQTGAVTVSYDQSVIVTAYKQTVTASGGVIGTALPVVAEERMLEAGGVADLVWISQSADPTMGSSSTLSFYLSIPNSNATVLLFDQNGTQVAQTTIAGGPRYVSIPVASLVQTDLPMARAQVQVTSGRITGYSEIVDNVTGEPMAARIATSDDEDTLVALNGVLRQTGADGVPLATDIRIFNLGAAQVNAGVNFGGAVYQLTVPARGIAELPDVLGANLGLTGPGGGTVLITGDHAIAAAGRLVRRDSSGGALGTIEVGSVTPAGVSNTQAAAVGGLRSSQNASALLVSTASAGPGSADLSLLDGSGSVVASEPGALQLGPGLSRVDSLPNLIGGATVPDDATAQLTGSGGGLSLDAVSIDQIAGAPTYLRVDPILPYLCAPPAFTSISASPATLTQPGNVTLNWTTQAADSVAVGAVPTVFAANGSTSMAVSGPTTINVIATNSCGSVTAAVGIFVGAPQATSVSNVSNSGVSTAASGSPGDTIAVSIGNLADITTVATVNFQGPDGQSVSVPVMDATTDGAALVRVPMWPAAAAPGYRTGAFTLSATIAGVTVGSLPFTINTLSYAGDPVADFGKLLDKVAADGNATLAGLKANGYSAVAAAQQQAAAGVEQTLRKMLSDVSASGTATIPVDFNSQDGTIQVTKNDLALTLAYLNNEIPLTPSNSATTSKEKSRDANPLNCLAVQRPLVPICKPLEAEKRFSDLVSQQLAIFNPGDLQNLPGADQIITYLKTRFAKNAVGALAKRLTGWFNYYDYVCLVAPVRLNNFSVYPKAIIRRPDRLSSTVDLKANLTAFTTSDKLASQLESQEIKLFLSQYCAKCSDAQKQAITQVLKPILQEENSDFDQNLASLFRTLAGFPQKDTVQVGSCDIENFYPKNNGFANDPSKADKNPNSLLVPDPAHAGYGDLSYYYFARRRGPETFCVDPSIQNFVLPLALERAIGSVYQRCRPQFQVGPVAVKSASRSAVSITPPPTPPDPAPLTYSDDVTVGDGNPQVVITSNDVNAYTSGSPTDNPDASFSAVTSSQPFNVSQFDGFATGSVTATQVSATRWTVQLSADSVPLQFPQPNGTVVLEDHVSDAFVMLDFTNPAVRDNTQHMHLSITSSDSSCPVYQWRLSWADDAGTPASQAQQNQPLPSLEMPAGVIGHLSMTVTPHGGNKATCVLTATIDLLGE